MRCVRCIVRWHQTLVTNLTGRVRHQKRISSDVGQDLYYHDPAYEYTTSNLQKAWFSGKKCLYFKRP